MSEIVEKCLIWQCWRITRSIRGSVCEWISKFNQFFLVHC